MARLTYSCTGWDFESKMAGEKGVGYLRVSFCNLVAKAAHIMRPVISAS